MIPIRLVATVAALAAAITVGASTPAWASNNSSTDGASAEYLTGNNEFRVCDTAADGHAVYVDWQANGQSGRFQHNLGNGNCRNSGRIAAISDGGSVRFRACENINNGPDDCDAPWETTTG